MRLVLAGEKNLELLLQDVQIAGSRVRSAGAVDNPELRVGQLSTKDLDGTFRSLEVGARWRNPGIGEPSAKKEIAKAQEGIKQADLASYRLEASLWARRVCVQIVTLEELIEIQREKVKLAADNVSFAERMVSLGERNALDLTEARLDLFKAREKQRRLVNQLKALKTDLATAMGIDKDFRLALLPEKPVAGSLTEYRHTAYQNRPELREARFHYQEAQARLHLEKLKAIPWFTFVEASYRTDYDEGEQQNEHWGELRFGFELPIFDQNRGGIKAEDLAGKRHFVDFQRTLDLIDLEVVRAAETYLMLLDDFKQYQQEAQPLLAKAATNLEQAESTGTLDPSKISDISKQLIGIRESIAEQRQQLAYARIDLLAAMGLVFKENLESRQDVPR